MIGKLTLLSKLIASQLRYIPIKMDVYEYVNNALVIPPCVEIELVWSSYKPLGLYGNVLAVVYIYIKVEVVLLLLIKIATGVCKECGKFQYAKKYKKSDVRDNAATNFVICDKCKRRVQTEYKGRKKLKQ
jgi:hypothetical protein